MMKLCTYMQYCTIDLFSTTNQLIMLGKIYSYYVTDGSESYINIYVYIYVCVYV